MRRFVFRTLVAVACVVLAPVIASAQTSTISGTVRDASGGVLPGVTIEVASPVLIEKVRTTVSDGDGKFTVVSLRPGTYTVTFSLTGFSTYVRDGIELTSDFNAQVNGEMTVGTLQESITVT